MYLHETLDAALSPSSMETLRALANAMPQPILILDTGHRPLGFNRAFRQVFAIPEGALDPDAVCDLVPADFRQACQAAAQAMDVHGVQSYHCDIRLADAPYRLDFRLIQLTQANRPLPIIVASLLDGTFALDPHARRQAVSAGHASRHDTLTGLFNRHAMQEIIEKTVGSAQRDHEALSVLLFDLDRFKLINDNYGNAIGDAVLVETVNASVGALRKTDWIGRWGGEEFICVLPGTDLQTATHLAEHLRRAVEVLDIVVQGHELKTTVSIGIASFPDEADSVDQLLAAADSALFEAKRGGRNRVATSQRQIPQIFSIAGELENALKQGRVIPAYQPIVDLNTGQVVADEALARIRQTDGTLLAAGHFIEAANHLQLTHKIDHIIATHSIRRCMAMQSRNPRGMSHFVNTSADLLRHPELVEDILRVAREACAGCFANSDPNCTKPLVIEITEREFLGNVQDARDILAPLIDFGLRIAIDDFGSGYSSFEYLVDLPVSFLKIEGSLVRRAREDKRTRAILRGIRDIAKELDLITIAEFIEDEATAAMLRDIGVDWGQGYHFGRPEAE
ncbi:MAG: bifunctional diguanylate cyclase/phosphodiesterase [Chromatiales bacterium]|nr:bifunctional diguanylate cyclase/phosphodiesterase [Chromatiales bacterium]